MSQKRSYAAFSNDHPTDSRKSSSQSSYALYGTPLPAYDSNSRDDGSYVPEWNQTVTDSQGRKRLHGAFTGGWSAGYYNTVGSKEGWTPATFVTSRSKKKAAADGGDQGTEGAANGKRKYEQKVEDFMDDEDLAERDATLTLETQGGFAGLGRSAAADTGEGGNGMFSDLFRTTNDSVGVKLLQRMGWKEGQGVGPKVLRRIKGDAKGEMHLLAPENSRMIAFERKTDQKGLGFSGEGRLSAAVTSELAAEEDDNDHDARILQSNRSKILSKPKKIKKSGFGLGVLNDTGSDDEDAFEMGPRINYNRVIGGDKKGKKAAKAGLATETAAGNTRNKLGTSSKLAERTATLSNDFRKCHDGRFPLDGFVLSLCSLTLTQDDKYSPPEVPEGWKPKRIASNAHPAPTAVYQSTAEAAKASDLDPKSRAALLGEAQLPGKSVFDFLTPAARERLAQASGKSNLPPALNEAPPTFSTSHTPDSGLKNHDQGPQNLPRLAKDVAEAALRRAQGGWMPYSEDLEKRARYRVFLYYSAHDGASGTQANMPSKPSGFSSDEWRNELQEFTQAAEVFRPVSGLMASRFTSATASTAKLASDAPDATEHAGDSKSKEAEEEDPAEKAARMGMYGPLTRSRLPFTPTRLLCKRFNVKVPASTTAGFTEKTSGSGGGGSKDAPVVRESRRLDVVSQASLDQMIAEARLASGPASAFVSGGVEGGEAAQAQTRLPAEMDYEVNEALETQRAGEDVFRSVFGDEGGG